MILHKNYVNNIVENHPEMIFTRPRKNVNKLTMCFVKDDQKLPKIMCLTFELNMDVNNVIYFLLVNEKN